LTRASISSTHWLGVETAARIASEGGNVYDMAAATALVIQIAEPHLNGPLGDTVILVRSSDGGVETLCGQGPIPAAAGVDAYRSMGFRCVPASGLLAAVVPGAFLAWITLAYERGKLGLERILQPAIEAALSGIPVIAAIRANISPIAELLRSEWQTTGRIFLPGGELPEVGTLIRNAEWGNTLKTLLDNALRTNGRGAQFESVIHDWADGFVSQTIGDFVRRPSLDESGGRNCGFLSSDDISAWRPHWEASTSARFRQAQIHKPTGWTQGPTALIQYGLLGELGFDPRKATATEFVHYVTEASRCALADRDAYLGDSPDQSFASERLYTREALVQRVMQIKDDETMDFVEPNPMFRDYGFIPTITDNEYRDAPLHLSQLSVGIPVVLPKLSNNRDTTAIVIADEDGNVVSALTSGGWFGSSPCIPGLGIALGTRAQMAWLVENHANTLSPGKRPRTTLSPTILEWEGGIAGVATPGGDQQDQWTVQASLRVLSGATFQDAVDAPVHHTLDLLPSFVPHVRFERRLIVEAGISARTVANLRAVGHDVQVSTTPLGAVCMAGTHLGRTEAARNRRRGHCAAASFRSATQG